MLFNDFLIQDTYLVVRLMFGKAGKRSLFIHQAKRIQVDAIDDSVISNSALDYVIVRPRFQSVPAINDEMKPIPIICRKEQIAILLNGRLSVKLIEIQYARFLARICLTSSLLFGLFPQICQIEAQAEIQIWSTEIT